MKCDYCKNKLKGLDICKFCHFEMEDLYTDDEWDILNLDDDVEWSFIQILNRIHSKNLPCLAVDVFGEDIIYLVGCNVFTSKIAEVLGVHEECICNQSDQAFIIINLFKEKYLRGYDLD